MHCLQLCHRSSGNGNERLWTVGTIYGSSEVAGVFATGGPVAGVLVAGGSVLVLSTVIEVSWDRFPSCGNCKSVLGH